MFFVRLYYDKIVGYQMFINIVNYFRFKCSSLYFKLLWRIEAFVVGVITDF
jgi:hypothetical protein